MPDTSPASLVNIYMSTAAAAVVTHDYATAIDNALAAQVLLAGLADMNRGSGGGGSQGMKWDRTGIDGFITAVRRQQNAVGGVKVVNNCYPRVSSGLSASNYPGLGGF